MSGSEGGRSLGEAAKELGISERQLYTELCRGRLHGRRVEGAVRVNQHTLKRYREQQQGRVSRWVL